MWVGFQTSWWTSLWVSGSILRTRFPLRTYDWVARKVVLLASKVVLSDLCHLLESKVSKSSFQWKSNPLVYTL